MQDIKYRIVIADGSSLFRDGVASVLEKAGYKVVAQAGDGDGTIQAVLVSQPDLVLLDSGLPGIGGIKAAERIRNKFPDIKIVILTGVEDDETLFAAIRAGVNGYLSKDLKATEFLEMLAGLERGEAAVTRKTAARLMFGFQQTSQVNEGAKCLTKQEIKVLYLMRDGSSNKEIANVLFISENTVKYHVRNILHKLGVKNRTEAVVYALQENLIHEDRNN